MRAPATIEHLLDVLARAAVGDTDARVVVDTDTDTDAATAGRPLDELGRAINLLLTDLSAPAAAVEAAERTAAGAARAQLLTLLRQGLQAPRAALAELGGPTGDGAVLRVVRDRLNALATTLDELDELVGVERGTSVTSEGAIDVRDLIRRGADGASVQPGARLELELDESLPAELRGDPERLTQLLAALLATAAATTPTGVITLRATADPAGAWWVLRLEVRDDGEGAPAAVLDRALDPYGGPPLGEAGLEHVLGLRLALARRIAEATGGRLELMSIPGHGTTALAIVPLAGPSAAGDPLAVGL